MTNKAVTNVNGLMTGLVQSGIGKTGTSLPVADSFSSVMQKTTNQNQKAEDAGLQPSDSKTPDIQPVKPVGKENTKTAEQIEKCAQNATDQTKEEMPEGVEEAVNEAAVMVVKKAADTLEVSPEEVEQAMETLGLTAISLLDSENLADLMLNLSGETERIALVTNEALCKDVKEILQMIQSELTFIQETYEVSSEQLKACIEVLSEEDMQSLTDVQPLTDIQPKDEEVQTLTGESEPVESTKAEQQPEKAVVTLTKNGEEIKAAAETDVKTGTAVVTQESAPLSQESEPLTGQNDGLTQEGQREEQNAKEQGNSETPANGNLVLQNLMQNQNTAAAVNGTEPVIADTEQAQDIMNQILDYMKVQIEPETTSLEMQLHPENLGTLNIHIAAKNGLMTAQFTAQNEAVKNVIETQLITLQQNLNEQGVKVEAVEVNVAVGQFDRNLNQGQESSGHASEETKKKQPRRINLSDSDGFAEEELEEADKVTADMMARNGNTVDYLV